MGQDHIAEATRGWCRTYYHAHSSPRRRPGSSDTNPYWDDLFEYLPWVWAPAFAGVTAGNLDNGAAVEVVAEGEDGDAEHGVDHFGRTVREAERAYHHAEAEAAHGRRHHETVL